MSAIANLVAYDSVAAQHTFIPVSVTREKGKVTALYRENTAGVPVGAQSTVTVSNEQLKSGTYKVEVAVAMPVLEAVNGANAAGYTAAPKVAHTPRLVTTGYFSDRSSGANRNMIRQIMANLLNGQTTSYTTTFAGPAPEAIDALISPT